MYRTFAAAASTRTDEKSCKVLGSSKSHMLDESALWTIVMGLLDASHHPMWDRACFICHAMPFHSTRMLHRQSTVQRAWVWAWPLIAGWVAMWAGSYSTRVSNWRLPRGVQYDGTNDWSGRVGSTGDVPRRRRQQQLDHSGLRRLSLNKERVNE